MGAKRLFTSSLVVATAILAALPAYGVSRHHRYRHVVWNPVLRGSHDSMTRQNEEIDRLQLLCIADEQQLLELERTQELVPVPGTQFLHWSEAIQANKRYARPWTNQFVQDMSVEYYKQFHVPLQINSAVRTM